jgi:periplasmic divalent cation tolerance protein
MEEFEIVLLYVTVPEAQAAQIADSLVQDGLVACVNRLDDVQSTYAWQGQVMHERESLLLCKTTRARAGEAAAAVQRLHPYDMPCVTVFEVVAGSRPFLGWVRESVRGDRGGFPVARREEALPKSQIPAEDQKEAEPIS